MVLDLLTQNRVRKTLKGMNQANMDDENWQDMGDVTLSTICMCLVISIIYDVVNGKIANSLWLKLESLFMF